MKMPTGALLLTFASPLLANGTVQSLNVVDGIATFHTSEPALQSPSCVSPGNDSAWAVSLDTTTGRSLYTMLLTSMAGKFNVAVTGTGLCDVEPGVQTATQIVMTPSENAGDTAASNGVTIYRQDGTLVGTIVEVVDKDTWLYADNANGPELLELDNGATTNPTFYFSQADCQGDMYTNIKSAEIPALLSGVQNGKWFKTPTSKVRVTWRSYTNSSGQCYAHALASGGTTYLYDTLDYNHPQCGEFRCYVN